MREQLQQHVLTLTNHGDDGEKATVTISPGQVQFIVSSETEQVINGVFTSKSNVFLADGGTVELNLTMGDLVTLQRAVGTYFLPKD